MFGINDDTVFSDFEQRELRGPGPAKEVDGRMVYVSRELRVPKQLGAPVLCDFGSAVFGGVEHTEDVQPDIYRAPEVILEDPWSYGIDIWNAGCMVSRVLTNCVSFILTFLVKVWDIFEGGHLFTGQDPEHKTYRSRAHLAEMIALLGAPPLDLLQRGGLSHKFFADDGQCNLISYVQLSLQPAGIFS